VGERRKRGWKICKAYHAVFAQRVHAYGCVCEFVSVCVCIRASVCVRVCGGGGVWVSGLMGGGRVGVGFTQPPDAGLPNKTFY